ncbi:RNA polymerase sigma factor [Cellulophaga baltica]|uniref:RNA polymerase sigma-70 factor, ECF subfamily n=1 Tax=Cellulophaga baltica TaxID=76594 RepID=A0A1G7CRF8_9FLAO|nr:RNA polymerase sigma factor [Cellulophaga baltica]SDE41791.1 RNA polymerase sigma-70 factor, ECF subfamily [Cellulophaga baltica]
MKIISFYTNEKLLIKKAVAGNAQAQKHIYEKNAPKMLSVCRQYIKDTAFSEDVMVTGFVKVFKYLDTFKFEGSFEGWIRRIMIRESITYLRKKQFVVFDDDVFERNSVSQISFSSEVDAEQIQLLIDNLPEGYKMVFMLYAVEGYKHSEIADMLNISESTSKSQLFKARRTLQEQMKEQKIVSYGTN